MEKRYKRRKYLINRRVQLKYLLLVVVMLVLYTAFLLAAVFVPQFLDFAAETSLAGKAAEAGGILELHHHFWPAAAVVIGLFGLGSIFVTHKIVGPLFSIDRTIREMAAGNLTVRARIRKGDELQEFHHNFNAMADNLERLLVDLEQGCRCLADCSEALAKEIASGRLDSPEIAKLLTRMKLDREKFCRDLQRYSFRRNQ